MLADPAALRMWVDRMRNRLTWNEDHGVFVLRPPPT
jgi:hypothetical protein